MPHNVARLGASIHAVFTAERAQSYKPRMPRNRCSVFNPDYGDEIIR